LVLKKLELRIYRPNLVWFYPCLYAIPVVIEL
jgi:hypothetical protein